LKLAWELIGTHLNGKKKKKKAGHGGVHPSSHPSQNGRAVVQAILDKKARSYLQNNQSRKGWRCG
jgi:hypothetical protein